MNGKVLFAVLLALMLSLSLQPVWADDDAIIDKDDSQRAVEVGTWNSSTFLPCAHGGAYQYAWGSGNLMAIDTDWPPPAGSDHNPVRHSPDIAGEYMVYAMWSSHPNRNDAVTYRIYEGETTLKATVTNVNQRRDGCQWNYLDTVTMSGTTWGRVEIDSTATAAFNEATIADGIRWVRVTKDSADILDNSLTSADIQNGSLRDIDIGDEAGGDGVGGDANVALSSTDQIVRNRTINAPTSGYVIVNASGTFWHLTSGQDIARCSITTGSTIDSGYMILTGDRGSSVDFSPFGATRFYTVSAGSTNYRLVCDNDVGSVSLLDPNLTAIFVPTVY